LFTIIGFGLYSTTGAGIIGAGACRGACRITGAGETVRITGAGACRITGAGFAIYFGGKILKTGLGGGEKYFAIDLIGLIFTTDCGAGQLLPAQRRLNNCPYALLGIINIKATKIKYRILTPNINPN